MDVQMIYYSLRAIYVDRELAVARGEITKAEGMQAINVHAESLRQLAAPATFRRAMKRFNSDTTRLHRIVWLAEAGLAGAVVASLYSRLFTRAQLQRMDRIMQDLESGFQELSDTEPGNDDT